MVEVQESFELNHETLYLAVKIVDTYLGKELVSKDALQLLGAAALLIACKFDVSVLLLFCFSLKHICNTFFLHNIFRKELHHLLMVISILFIF